MHQRLAQEFLLRLSKRALWVISPALREEEFRDAFEGFHAAFKEELDWYEFEKERMAARLAGRPMRTDAPDDNGNGAVPGDQEQSAGEKP